jgi:XapX domain-containing protein
MNQHWQQICIANGCSQWDLEREPIMKVFLASFAVGLFVGVLYGLIRVKSPAPPIVALLGLLGMVVGEQFGNWMITKEVSVAHAASVCLVGKNWDDKPNGPSEVPAQLHMDSH